MLGSLLTFLLVLTFCFLNACEAVDWSMKGLKDPGCGECRCMGEALKQSWHGKVLRIMEGRTYYPMGSKYGYAATHVRLRGRLPRNNKDVDGMCESVDYASATSICSSLGFGRNVTAIFVSNKLSKMTYYNFQQLYDPHAMSDWAEKMYSYFTSAVWSRVIWTDGNQNILVTTCFRDGQTVWDVRSNQRKMEKSTKKAILKKVESLGFDMSKYYEISAEACDA